MQNVLFETAIEDFQMLLRSKMERNRWPGLQKNFVLAAQSTANPKPC